MSFWQKLGFSAGGNRDLKVGVTTATTAAEGDPMGDGNVVAVRNTEGAVKDAQNIAGVAVNENIGVGPKHEGSPRVA